MFVSLLSPQFEFQFSVNIITQHFLMSLHCMPSFLSYFLLHDFVVAPELNTTLSLGTAFSQTVTLPFS